VYAGVFNIEKAVTPNKKTYLLMNLPYYAATSMTGIKMDITITLSNSFDYIF